MEMDVLSRLGSEEIEMKEKKKKEQHVALV